MRPASSCSASGLPKCARRRLLRCTLWASEYISAPSAWCMLHGLRVAFAVMCLPPVGDSRLHQMAEARKAVSASMTAEGMRQQNEALRWALRAPFPDMGDESTLFTGSDESGARSAGTAGGCALPVLQWCCCSPGQGPPMALPCCIAGVGWSCCNLASSHKPNITKSCSATVARATGL